ncbi:hypothetical protein H0H87_002739 [Tephrocybe sp. NHM501043]|nr:hypothetical protein H0H87_002739 [Tephrocybe sp. NHM501043]
MDADFDPTQLYPTSGRNSPHERQPMLTGDSEGVQSTRLMYGLNNTGASSLSSGHTPSYSHPTSAGSMPSSHNSDLPSEISRSSGPDIGTLPSYHRMPRAASYRSVASSPLNPSIPSGPPQSHIHSPFARPGSRGGTQIKRIPSEESRAFSNGYPFALDTKSSRGSMILYRKADSHDEPLAPPVPYAKRESMLSVDSAVSLSDDSKYPVGTTTSERGLIAYAWDPLGDGNEPIDEEDKLHDPEGIMSHDSVRLLSARGIINFTAIILLLSGLLSLFVVYPVYSFYQDNGINALIVGNTRINKTGQASSLEFDSRSQIPVM